MILWFMAALEMREPHNRGPIGSSSLLSTIVHYYVLYGGRYHQTFLHYIRQRERERELANSAYKW